MKPNYLNAALAAFFAFGLGDLARAQTPPATPPAKHHHKKNTDSGNGSAGAAGATNSADAAAAAQQFQNYENAFVPADPWRVMEEKTNYAKGPDWVQFEGRVTSVSSEGMVLTGWFAEPLAYLKGATTTTTFFLSNYPRRVPVGQLLSRSDRLVALKAGMKDDMPNLNYGRVWVPELTEEQKAQIAQNKSKTESKVLAWHQQLADQGDAYGEYKMGMRYLNGDGVDKDAQKAHDLLAKSAAQGNKDAAEQLAKPPAR